MNRLRPPRNRKHPLRRASVRLWLATALWTGALSGSVLSQDNTDSGLSAARKAITQGADQVAAGILERLLAGEQQLSSAEREEARVLRARIWLHGGEWEAVERLFSEGETSAIGLVCLGHAAYQSGRWSVAVERFTAAQNAGADVAECTLGRAAALPFAGRAPEAVLELRALAKQGKGGNTAVLALAGLLLDGAQATEVREVLRGIRDVSPVDKGRLDLVLARLQLAEGLLGEARLGFDALQASAKPVPPEVLVGAVLGAADVLEKEGAPGRAANHLLLFLKLGRDINGQEPLFQRLVSFLLESTDPPEADFRGLIGVGGAAHRALARFYLAQFYFGCGKTAKGGAELEAFCSEFPEHPLFSAACLQLAEAAMESARWTEAERLLRSGLAATQEPRVLRPLEMRLALVAYRTGKFDAALSAFERIGSRWPQMQVEASFNMGLAAVQMGNLKRASAELRTLEQAGGGDGLAAELEIEIALRRAADGLADAESALQLFVKKHPDHPRLGDAKVGIAEICSRDAARAGSAVGSQSARALRSRASDLLRTVANDPQSAQAAAQAQYLAVFLADAAEPRREEDVLEMGEAFLRAHPDSQLVPEMRMKMGEVYFRRKDFAGAEEQFAKIAAQNPAGPLAERALFLAGQCAASRLNPGSVDEALRYWDKVAGGTGALRWKARYQQAAVKSRMSEELDGAALFDLVLKATEGVDPELRRAARCGKADALLALAKRTSGSLEPALGEYRALAEASETTPVWRNQALYKIAKVLEISKSSDALEAFYRVLDAPDSDGAGEFFWRYKAGFDAVRILEGRKAWRDCAVLLERLGALGGPRAPEARARALQLRVEHFLWD